MPQIVEADVRQASLLEQNFQTAIGRVRVHGQLRTGRLREYPLAHRPLLSLPQELYDALGQDDGTVALAGLGGTQREYAQLLAVEGAADVERAFLLIEVLPHQAADLAPPQAGHELGVEELVPDLILADELHESFQLLLVEDFLRLVVGLGRSGPLGGIAGNDVGLHRVLHGTVEHGVDVIDGGVGEGMAAVCIFVDPSVLFQVVIHPLNVVAVDEGDLLVAQLRFDVGFDELTVAGQRGGADGALLVVLQPGVQPLAQRHAAVLGQLHVAVALNAHVELVHQFFLRVGVVVMEDGVAVFLVSDDDAPFPAAIVAAAHRAVTGWSSFCHLGHLLGVVLFCDSLSASLRSVARVHSTCGCLWQHKQLPHFA